MKALHEIFPDILRKQPQKQLPLEDIVRAAWTHVVGHQLAARSEVFRLYNETLIVHVPDATWQRQWYRLERKLLGRINQMLGRTLITGMDFRVDESLACARGTSRPAGLATETAAARPAEQAAETAAVPPRKGPAREPAPAAEAELAASARAIDDPELRELFIRTSRKMMK